MTYNEVLNKVCRIVATKMHAKKVTAKTTFDDLFIDSLEDIQIILLLEKEFNVHFSEQDLIDLGANPSMNTLAVLVCAKKGIANPALVNIANEQKSIKR